MNIITFNTLKPLALTALFIVFAASLNTAEAQKASGLCESNAECLSKDCHGFLRMGSWVITKGTCADYTCTGDC